MNLNQDDAHEYDSYGPLIRSSMSLNFGAWQFTFHPKTDETEFSNFRLNLPQLLFQILVTNSTNVTLSACLANAKFCNVYSAYFNSRVSANLRVTANGLRNANYSETTFYEILLVPVQSRRKRMSRVFDDYVALRLRS